VEIKNGRIENLGKVQMVETLRDTTWEILLKRIKDGRCTPFLGAGACFPALPLASTIASAWAQEYNYPGDNPKSLIEVAQYLAIQFDPIYPKEKILKELDGVAPPDFNAVDEPHGLLADLPLPIYLTTNYDHFMELALKSRGRDPRSDFCRWNRWIENEPGGFDQDEVWRPTIDNPLVFHLHGHTIPESIVLTEDDYLSFLGNMSDQRRLPARIHVALSGNTCLFIGYRLADWNFRVLFHGISQRSGFRSIAVLKPPGDDDLALRQREYLAHYYENEYVEVYWGTAREFAAELRERWNIFSKA
jgi:hypothetical protein